MNYEATQTIGLLDVLQLLSPHSSKNTLKNWIKEGRVLIDEEPAKNGSVAVSKGQKVSVGQRKRLVNEDLPIVYEDADIVIVDKPSGLLSVSTAFEKQKTVHSLLKTHYHPRKIFVVHRLDQDTSGVMVFAFNEPTLLKLKVLFEAHTIERAYTAIVEGKLHPSSGVWKSYQIEDKQYVVHETTNQKEGRLAITHFNTLTTRKHYTLIELTLETGRKNQIRVHCQSAGCPVAGDKKYGARHNPLKRLCLHAHLLAFQHPTTKRFVRFESPLPQDFYKIVPPFRESVYKGV